MNELERRYRSGLRQRQEELASLREGLGAGGAETSETPDRIRRLAHDLRGSGGSYGHPDVSRLAARVEEAPGSELAAAVDDLLGHLGGVLEGDEEADRSLVLVIEGDPEISHLLQVVLGGDGREVAWAESGAEGRRVVETRSVDLVLMDLILPDTDGRSLLARLRDTPATAGLPVLVLSIHDDDRIRRECLRLGADAFVAKPFDPEMLRETALSWLRRAEEWEREGRRDELTGLLNRAGLREVVEGRKDALSLVRLDLDDFVSVNERFGRQAGDEALRRVAERLVEEAGEEAVVARWGGSEFLVLLAEEGVEEATERAEALVGAVREEEMRDGEGDSFRVTATAGVVVADPAETPLEEIVDEAEACLLLARRAGGNRAASPATGVEAAAGPVLVAEDDEITASLLVHRLEKSGLEVVRARTGIEAFETAVETVPSLVIMDVKMPGMDGFEVLDRLRKVPSLHDVPVIMLSSMGSESDIVRGFRMGADDYMLKPFSPTELLARVHRLLGA